MASSSHRLFLPPPLQVRPPLPLRTIGRPRSRPLGRLLLLGQGPWLPCTPSSSSHRLLLPPPLPPTTSLGPAATASPHHRPPSVKAPCLPPPPTGCISHSLLLLGQGPWLPCTGCRAPPSPPPTASSSHHLFRSGHRCFSAPSPLGRLLLPPAASPAGSSSSIKALGCRAPPPPPPTASSSHRFFLPPSLQVWPLLPLRTIGRPRSRPLGRLLLPPAASPTASSSLIKTLGCHAPPLLLPPPLQALPPLTPTPTATASHRRPRHRRLSSIVGF